MLFCEVVVGCARSGFKLERSERWRCPSQHESAPALGSHCAYTPQRRTWRARIRAYDVSMPAYDTSNHRRLWQKLCAGQPYHCVGPQSDDVRSAHPRKRVYMMNKDSEVTMANTARCQDKIRRGPCRIPGPFHQKPPFHGHSRWFHHCCARALAANMCCGTQQYGVGA